LVLAVVSGVAAAYLALGYLQRTNIVPTPAVASSGTLVAVAARDLAMGTVLDPADVEIVDWPTSAVPVGYARSADEVVGRGLITTVSAGEPLLNSKLASKEAGGGLPIVIPEGMRAVSVKVDEVIGVAGFVLPGTRVDVLVTLNPSAQAELAATRVILQNVQTLAAGQTIQRDQDGTPQTVTVITLLVTPDQAQKLTLASTKGRIQLALRNTLDMEEVDTTAIRAGNLIEKADRPVVKKTGTRRAPRPQVEVYNGAKRSVTTF
jgi:pilus assembly protein CpaB